MNKIDEFKDFVKTKPHLKKMVDNKETTWQSLYETYDLYGIDNEIFKESVPTNNKENNNDSVGGVNSLLKIFEGVDMNKISENLDGLKKILGVVSEFSKKETPSEGRKNTIKPNRRFDD